MHITYFVYVTVLVFCATFDLFSLHVDIFTIPVMLIVSMKYMLIILHIYIKNKHADVVIDSFFKYIDLLFSLIFNCSVTTCQVAYITF